MKVIHYKSRCYECLSPGTLVGLGSEYHFGGACKICGEELFLPDEENNPKMFRYYEEEQLETGGYWTKQKVVPYPEHKPLYCSTICLLADSDIQGEKPGVGNAPIESLHM